MHYCSLQTFVASEQAGEQDARAIDGEQGADGVELGREDLQHNEGKGELSQRRADVSALESPLGCADLDQFAAGQDDGAGAVQTQLVPVFGASSLDSTQHD